MVNVNGAGLEGRLAALTADVRSYDAVVVVGAGLSAFAYPMTSQLPALLWQAITEIDGAAEELVARTGKSGTPKEILGTHPATVAPGWKLARELHEVRDAFQKAFVNLDAEREPSAGHLHLARLIHERRVRLVVSYNWDSCLERAHDQLYGTPVPDRVLFKPHGDVLAPGKPWTLPDEDGLVPAEILGRISELGTHPRTLLILGYSGSDAQVAETLLTPLQIKWPVYQISPSASGPDGVPTTADEVAGALVDRLLAPLGSSGWRHVTFNQHRNFAAALRGERLRPADVDACPELPSVKRLAERLAASQYATLSGGSGTGKSITAFHAARRLNKKGWTVVELTRPGVAGEDEVRSFGSMTGPILAVVDDAQALDPGIVADFGAAVDQDHAVLLVSTERLEAHSDETVAESRAKELVYEHCVAHLAEIEPLLMSLDNRVGYGMTLEPPVRRLQAADASSRDPWSFMFVASGGERRIGGIIDRLAEDHAQVLVLAAIAAGQLSSLDVGVSSDEVILNVARVAPGAFGPPTGVLDQARFNDAFAAVRAERIVRDSGGQLRTAHIRVADRALLELARHRLDAVGEPTRALVRNYLLNPDGPLLGKYWMVDTLGRSDSLRGHKWRDQWLDDSAVDSLVEQVLTSGPGRDRSIGAHLLGSLSSAGVLTRRHWEAIAGTITGWLPDLTADEVYGVSRVFMYMRNDNTDLKEQVSRSLPASAAAHMFSTRGTRPSAHAWSELLRELAPAYDSGDRETWQTEFVNALDLDALQAWVASIDADSHPTEVYHLVDTLAALAPAAATAVLQACADHLRTNFETDLANGAAGMHDWVFGSMPYVAQLAPAVGAPDDEDGELDSAAQEPGKAEAWEPSDSLIDFAAVTLQVMQQIDWAKAGASLSGQGRYEIESLDLFLAWLGWLSADLLDDVTDAISFDWLTDLAILREDELPSATQRRQVTGDSPTLATRIDRISNLLGCLAAGPRGRAKVRAYVAELAGTLECFPFELIHAFPDLATETLRSGGQVLLKNPRGGSWTENLQALQSLYLADSAAAAEVLAASLGELREALESPQSHDMRNLANFLKTADEVDSEVLDNVLTSLDVDRCASSWRQRIGDAGLDARSLVERTSKLEGTMGDMARSLLDPDVL